MVVYFLFVKSGGSSIDTRHGHKSKEGPEDYTVCTYMGEGCAAVKKQTDPLD